MYCFGVVALLDEVRVSCIGRWFACDEGWLWLFLDHVKQADGRTPLYGASSEGHVEAVAALVGAGAAVNQAEVSVDGGGMGMFVRVGCELYCCGGLRGLRRVCCDGRWFACDE